MPRSRAPVTPKCPGCGFFRDVLPWAGVCLTCHDGGVRLPAEPTAHPPGSPGKIAVMEARYARGEHVHHPLDARSWAAATAAAETSTGEDDGDE